MLDVLITGGEVVDGTGAPRRSADVGIRDGRIVAIGEIEESARRTIDAAGMIVAPGFVDIHTHYDAQVFWDSTASPSPLHGVTTVVGGNCGFTIAPIEPEQSDYLMKMLARVEGMPLESLEAGVPWGTWRTFGEYLDRLDGRVGPNVGFLVGHSAVRRVVMGEASVGEEANDDQLKAMVQLLHESLEAGGLGFSSSNAPTHNDAVGQPVPSRFATRDEMLALAGATGEHPGTTLEYIPTVGAFSDEHKDLMASMSRVANRPLNWNLLAVNASRPKDHEAQLAASDYAAERGGRVVALAVADPVQIRLTFLTGFVLDALPGWSEIIGLPIKERIEALSDPNVRQRMKEQATSTEAQAFKFISNWPRLEIGETFSPRNQGLAGRTIGDVAAERNQDPFETMMDIVVEDELRTSLLPPAAGDDPESWRLRAQVWRDPRVVIGASDAGAHLDLLATFIYSSSVVGPSVRERGLLPLEEAVYRITDVPARLYGIRDRGRLAEGYYADVVVFDENRIAPGPVHTRHDMPAGAPRLFGEAEGIEHVLVNGVELVRGKAFTGAEPGTVLRSGRDTDTVTVS